MEMVVPIIRKVSSGKWGIDKLWVDANEIVKATVGTIRDDVVGGLKREIIVKSRRLTALRSPSIEDIVGDKRETYAAKGIEDTQEKILSDGDCRLIRVVDKSPSKNVVPDSNIARMGDVKATP